MNETEDIKIKSTFRQERFASSEAYQKGLLANLVAKRCSILNDPQERELIWFLQEVSHRDGIQSHHTCNLFDSWPWPNKTGKNVTGLERVAQELLNMFPEKLGTKIMHELGYGKNRTYNTNEVKRVREDFELFSFPLQGENANVLDELSTWSVNESLSYSARKEAITKERERRKRSARLPTSYPAQAFLNDCLKTAEEELAHHLQNLALDPEIDLSNSAKSLKKADVWYFQDLIKTLQEYKKRFETVYQNKIVPTEISKQTSEMLDYALNERCMVLIEGNSRTGKSFSTQAWCQSRLGCVRYIQLKAYTDEASFFRAIAQGLGVACSTQRKAAEMRTRIEETLQYRNLMLVIDEADYVWPRTNCPKSAPHRVDWINTALVNYGVPVALVALPKFSEALSLFEKRCRVWDSEQFYGRLADRKRLPSELNRQDLEAIVKSRLPYAEQAIIEMLAAAAESSESYVAAIEKIIRKAHYYARQDGYQTIQNNHLLKASDEVLGVKSHHPLSSSIPLDPIQTVERITKTNELDSNKRTNLVPL